MSESKSKPDSDISNQAVVGTADTGKRFFNPLKQVRRVPKNVFIVLLCLVLVAAGIIGWHFYKKVPSPTEVESSIVSQNYKKAEEQINKAISKTTSKSDKARLYGELGTVYNNEHQPDKAVEAYKQAAALGGMTAQLARTIAAIYYFNGNKEQAAVYYQKALDLWPKNDPLYGAETRALKQTIQDLQK